MRLSLFQQRQTLLNRARFAWRRMRQQREVTDIHRVLFYRSPFFGRPFDAYWRHAQYDAPSTLSTGERQVLAAIISQSNRCAFCTVGHAEAACRYLPQETVSSALRSSDEEPLGPHFSALARFCRKLTVDPMGVDANDVERVLDAGCAQNDVKMAIHLCTAYSVINRVADAFDLTVPSIYPVEVDEDTQKISVAEGV